MDHVAIECRGGAVFREQRHLRRSTMGLIYHLHRSTPRRFLPVVDLAQVQLLALDHTPVGDAAILNDAPVSVLFAVVAACLGWQEHADRVGQKALELNDLGRHYSGFLGTRV